LHRLLYVIQNNRAMQRVWRHYIIQDARTVIRHVESDRSLHRPMTNVSSCLERCYFPTFLYFQLTDLLPNLRRGLVFSYSRRAVDGTGMEEQTRA